jgi:hypothetical protein
MHYQPGFCTILPRNREMSRSRPPETAVLVADIGGTHARFALAAPATLVSSEIHLGRVSFARRGHRDRRI